MPDGKIELRVAFGKHPRVRFYVANEDRKMALAELVAQVKSIPSERFDYSWCVDTLEKAATASDEKFPMYATAIKLVLDGADRKRPTQAASTNGETFKSLAENWTSGALAREWPDYVKIKSSAADDVNRFERLFKTIGDIPLARFELADAERAMAALDHQLASGTRRQYAQLISKVLKLAVYPCKLIERTPLPVGFLPKVKGKKATAFLYPSEDAQLLSCKKVPLARRVLYGFLAREGLRLGEALGLRWRDLDLVRGVVTLDENKTDDPRAWAMAAGVKEALLAYKRANASAEALVFPAEERRAAQVFRSDLGEAEVTRPELFSDTAARKQIRVHDLRSTFVTLSLANDKTETWVADRTGHKSSTMINRYRRQARQAAELKLGALARLDLAIPELAPKAANRPPEPGQKPGQKGSSGAPSRPVRVASRANSSGILRLRTRPRTSGGFSKSVARKSVSVQVRPSVPQQESKPRFEPLEAPNEAPKKPSGWPRTSV
jgi:integrase